MARRHWWGINASFATLSDCRNASRLFTKTCNLNTMKIEHMALNVSDPVAVAAWYSKHLGLRVVRHIPQPAQTHFLSDSNSSIIEVYCNPRDQVPDYRAMNPLLLHLAFSSTDPAADSLRLVAAGATVVDEVRLDDGSHLMMLRDPWGLAVQLCRRTKPLE